MGEYDGEVVVQVVLTHKILLQMLAVLDWQSDFSVSVHDVHFGDFRETMLFCRFQMGLRFGATSAVSRIALHDSSVYFLHQIFDESGLQVVVVARFSCRKFHSHLTFGLAAESLVNFDEVCRIDFPDKIDFWMFMRSFRSLTLCGYISCSHE